MHRIFKYILIVFILLLSFNTAKYESGLSKGEKPVLIKLLEALSKNKIADNQLVPEYISCKSNTDNSVEIIAPIEYMVSKNLKKVSTEHATLEKTNSIWSEIKEVISPGYFRVIFDNDIFDNTDYYYTNGVRFEYVSALLNKFSLGKLLPSLNKADIDVQGLSLVQNIYTPVNPDTRNINKNDRPFSAYLTLGLFHKSINIEKGLKVSSEFLFGIMGPASLGGFVQSGIHDIEPVGWENQINNDIYLNYSIRVDKLVLGIKNFELKTNANAKIGTIYNNIGAGLNLRFGKFNRFVENDILYLENTKKHRLNYWIFTRLQGNLIAYNATLQGGLFNDSNRYVVDNNLINTFVFKASAGIAIYYKSFGLELENFYLSPEFKGAYDFRYGRLNLIFGF